MSTDQFKNYKKKFFSACNDIIILKSTDLSSKESVFTFPPIYCHYGYSDIISKSFTKRQQVKMYINDHLCESVSNLGLDEKGLVYFKKNNLLNNDQHSRIDSHFGNIEDSGHKSRSPMKLRRRYAQQTVENDIELDKLQQKGPLHDSACELKSKAENLTENNETRTKSDVSFTKLFRKSTKTGEKIDSTLTKLSSKIGKMKRSTKTGINDTGKKDHFYEDVLANSNASKDSTTSHNLQSNISLHLPLSPFDKKSPRLNALRNHLHHIKLNLSLQKEKEAYCRVPSEKQIRSMSELFHLGRNKLKFELKRKYFPSAVVTSYAYVWSPETPIIVFDIYGTITRQGIVPHGRGLSPVVRSSVVKFLQYLRFVLGYNIVYMSFSPLSDATEIRQLLKACPPGPVLLGSEGIIDHLKDKVVGSSSKGSLFIMLDDLWLLHKRRYEKQILEIVVSEAEDDVQLQLSPQKKWWSVFKSKTHPDATIRSERPIHEELSHLGDVIITNTPPSRPIIIAGFGNEQSDMKELTLASVPIRFKLKSKRSIIRYDTKKNDKVVFQCKSNPSIEDISFTEIQDILHYTHSSFSQQGLHPESVLGPLTFNLLALIFEYIPFDRCSTMKVKSQKMELAAVCQTWKRIIEFRFKSYLMETYAKKIGLSLDDLSSQAHLFKFLSNNYMHKKVAPWNHRVKNEAGEVVIRFKEREMTFEEIQSYFVRGYEVGQGIPTDKIVIDEEYRMLNTVYNYKGIITKPDLKQVDIESFDIMSNDDALEKFVEENGIIALDKKDPSEWENENVLVIKIERGKKGIRNRGDHTWLQLWSSEGYIFSFGVYRESFDAKLQLGDVRSPDDGEFYTCRGGEHAILPLKCSRKQLGAFLKSNLLHIRDRDVVYSLTLYNCTDYVLEQYVSQLDISFHTRFNLINHALGNETWDHISSRATKRFPTKLANFATNTTLMLGPNITLSIMSAQKSMELKKRLMEDDYQDIVDQYGNLFFMDTDSKTRIKYLKLRLVDGQIDRVSSPWKLGQIIDAITMERKKRGDRWYIPSKYIKSSPNSPLNNNLSMNSMNEQVLEEQSAADQ